MSVVLSFKLVNYTITAFTQHINITLRLLNSLVLFAEGSQMGRLVRYKTDSY